MSESVEAQWVVGVFEGLRGKSVLEHANQGSGYLILENKGNKNSPYVLAAFRYAGPMPVPEHLEKVTDVFKVQDYEQKRLRRSGVQVIEKR